MSLVPANQACEKCRQTQDAKWKWLDKRLDEFQDNLIKCLKWDNPDYAQERSQLGIKFDILKDEIQQKRKET
jgi:hypothetical protein